MKKNLLLAAVITAVLAACGGTNGKDGQDGKDGTDGMAGATVSDGAAGKDDHSAVFPKPDMQHHGDNGNHYGHSKK